MDEQFVFISYSSKDYEFVQRLLTFLERNKIRYWVAPQCIPVGSNYAHEIPIAIKNCSAMVLIVSEASQRSIWVEKELDNAVCNRKPILPISLDHKPLNETFYFYLNNIQVVPYYSNSTNCVESIRRRLFHILGRDMEKKEEVDIKDGKVVANYVPASRNDQQVQERITSVSLGKKIKLNALRNNRIPVICEHCGGEVEQNLEGKYYCTTCGEENYDDFSKIRNYLEKVGPRPAMVIARNTGVPVKAVDYFFQEEFLEVPKNSAVTMVCEKCGMPIRTGRICDSCKAQVVPASPEKKKGAWHSDIWKR